MSYKNRTPIYKIPSIGAGDFISESVEQRFAQIIENQLIGAISAHSGGHGIFKTGKFSVSGDSTGFLVILNPDGGTPAIEGFIRYLYFKVNETVQWPIFGDGLHRLYAKIIESIDGSTRQFGDIFVDSTKDTIPDNSLLIAEVTVSGNTVTINTDPSDKLKIFTIPDHITNKTNPHGTLITQDQMIISGLTSETVKTKTLEVTGELINSGVAIFNKIETKDLIIEKELVVSGAAIFNRGGDFRDTAFFDKMVVSDLDIVSGLDTRNRVRFFEYLEVDSGITIDGRDIGQDGLVLDNHVSGLDAFKNPHKVTAAQVSGIPFTGSDDGGPILQGDLKILSGFSIDGIDPTTLVPLIDGSNVDSLHKHNMSGIPEQFISLSPEYCGSVLSGAGIVTVETLFDGTSGLTEYQTIPLAIGKQPFSLVTRIGLPADFKRWSKSGITLINGVDELDKTDNYVSVSIKDTDNKNMPLDNAVLRNPKMTESILITSGLNNGTFIPGKIFTTIIEMSSLSGVSGQSKALVSDLILKYETKFK